MTDVTQEKKKGSTPGAPTVIIERIRDRFTHDSSGHYRVTTRGDGQTNTELINARVEITAAYSDDIGEPYPISVTEASDRAQPEITHYDLTVSRRGRPRSNCATFRKRTSPRSRGPSGPRCKGSRSPRSAGRPPATTS